MILLGAIKPAQLKAFSGIVDLYRDHYGRTIARSWPKTPKIMNPGLLLGASRIKQMHLLLTNTSISWQSSWKMPNMPTGRTPEDLRRQNILWQLQNLPNCLTPSITTLGHDYDPHQDIHTLYFVASPDYSWQSYPWQWTISQTLYPSQPKISWITTNQLFRRGDETLRRPIEIIPPNLEFFPEEETPWPDWHTISLHAAENVNFSGYLRPYWTESMPPPPRTSSRTCYTPAPQPLPLAGPYFFGFNGEGTFPWST